MRIVYSTCKRLHVNSDLSKIPQLRSDIISLRMAGVTMTLFGTHGRVSGPNSLLGHEVIAPCGYGVPCQF